MHAGRRAMVGTYKVTVVGRSYFHDPVFYFSELYHSMCVRRFLSLYVDTFLFEYVVYGSPCVDVVYYKMGRRDCLSWFRIA